MLRVELLVDGKAEMSVCDDPGTLITLRNRVFITGASSLCNLTKYIVVCNLSFCMSARTMFAMCSCSLTCAEVQKRHKIRWLETEFTLGNVSWIMIRKSSKGEVMSVMEMVRTRRKAAIERTMCALIARNKPGQPLV
jgi:hypothetical protein